jgi:hypothetical protein
MILCFHQNDGPTITDLKVRSQPTILDTRPVYATLLTYKENTITTLNSSTNYVKSVPMKALIFAIERDGNIVTLYYRASELEYGRYFSIFQQMMDSLNIGSRKYSTVPSTINLLGNSENLSIPIISAAGKKAYHTWIDNDTLLFTRSTDGGATSEPPIVLGYGPSDVSMVTSGTSVYVVWTAWVQNNDTIKNVLFTNSTDGRQHLGRL